MVLRGHKVLVYETIRTEERQSFLYLFGREYDDPWPHSRGIVTNARTAKNGWHFYGLAADIVENDQSPWDATPTFWNDLGSCARSRGLTWGGDWVQKDRPHVQWGKCKKSPSEEAHRLYEEGGLEAVHRAVKAR